MTPGLEAVVRALEMRTTHTTATLADALRGQLTIDDVAPWIRFDGGSYVRNLITRTERWELRLLCWRPGQTTSLHGHGNSACAFRILRGSASETILGSRDRMWAPGDVVGEAPELVHQVRNPGDDALLSLHAYSPQLPIDAPSRRDGHNVVIVGGGFSGIATAFHLLRHGGADLRITLVERGPWLGRGVAYGVDSGVFRLNVPASKMSIDPEQRDDFVKWAGASDHPHAFLPRTVYGQYVTARFADALRAGAGKLRVIRGEAASIDSDGVLLADGNRLPAAAIVLATGLAPRITRSMLPTDPRIVDAWDECALAALPRDGRLLILGSGLTALDVVSFLDAHGFRGAATILSRRGLLPAPHLPHAAVAALSNEIAAGAPRELRGLLRWGRSIVAQAAARGEPWQHAIDSIRPHVSALWRGLPPHDRARFVRSVRPYWEVLRHRAPPDSHALVEKWQRAGMLERRAGSIGACRPAADGVDVELRLACREMRRVRYDAIVRCIGPAARERAESDAPIVHGLIESGRAMADPAGLGIATDEDGHVLMADGRPSSQLFAVGALRRASSWETTAVPDIAVHAATLARRIAR